MKKWKSSIEQKRPSFLNAYAIKSFNNASFVKETLLKWRKIESSN
jgi:hypothetical protein